MRIRKGQGLARTRFWARVGVAVPCALLCASACVERTGLAPRSSAAHARLSVDARFFRDDLGRAVILRGVNVRANGLFDVAFDDGRLPLEEVPELRREDCARMAELGLGLVRLPLSWSGIEPRKDVFDEAYLKRVDEAVRCL